MADEFPIVPAKTAVLFFDTLNGGLHPRDNPTATAEIEASGYIGRLQAVEQACRAAGVTVSYTLPEHREDGSDWGLTVVGDPPVVTKFRGLNFKGSYHATVIPEIEPQPGDYVITKHRWSAFFQTNLELSLRTRGIDTIILAGGSTAVGIASTAYSARDRDFNLIVLSDAIRGRTEELNDFFMTQVFPGLARVMTVERCLEMLSAAKTA